AGQTMRTGDGGDNGVRLLDLNNDGYLDVVIANDMLRQTRIWSPKTRTWASSDFPVPLSSSVASSRTEVGARFGIVGRADQPALIVSNESVNGGWRFVENRWVKADELVAGLELDGQRVLAANRGRDNGVRLRDVDSDGRCELIVSNDRQQAIFGRSEGA